ncbi:phospholipase D-like domain-containing protein [Galbibacter pacificus]|uniref:phospholipase D n=1 Tax=Galbibacter pacificus TaxID=2996052 RepID=A0ABT6FN48_9FLAO|nr:phospholipase D-like domain-containing protein [Galbibacter pacificus]MDG3581124.1 phospholipase D-like domain-containing protein [Galbibacter pacificus]MDG3584602.1 phospholipase D-like domain-containing protein [Galbibacter pacificus]
MRFHSPVTKAYKKHCTLLIIILYAVCISCIDKKTERSKSIDHVVSSHVTLFSDLKLIEGQKPSTMIMDSLINLVDRTYEKDTIYMGIYLFEHQGLINALIRAGKRKVQLNILVDSSKRSNNGNTVTTLSAMKEHSEVVTIKNNNGASAINHNKFVLFSGTTFLGERQKNIVFQTSHNFIEKGTHKIQDANIISNRNLYDAYVEYWSMMKSHKDSTMNNYEFMEFYDEPSHIRAQFYPKRHNGKVMEPDGMVTLLKQIKNPDKASVQIGMSDWSDSRTEIADELIRLCGQGTKVTVITKNGKGLKLMGKLEEIKQQGGRIKIYNLVNKDKPRINIHMKTMLIKEMVQGKPMTKVVTGTQNFTNNAIWNNNETTLIFNDTITYKHYSSFFKKLMELPGVDG